MNPTYDAAGSPYAANWNPQAYWGMGNVWGQGAQGGGQQNPMIAAIMSLMQGRGMSSFGMPDGGSGGVMGPPGGMLGASWGGSPWNAAGGSAGGNMAPGGLGQAYSNNFGSAPMHPVMLFGGMPGSTNQGGMLSGMK